MRETRREAVLTGTALMSSLLVLCLTAIVFAGCQKPGRVVVRQRSKVCPMCFKEVRTASVKGLTYTNFVCPTCRKVTHLDPNTPQPLTVYDDLEPEERITYVCDECGAVITDCPVCEKQSSSMY